MLERLYILGGWEGLGVTQEELKEGGAQAKGGLGISALTAT